VSRHHPKRNHPARRTPVAQTVLLVALGLLLVFGTYLSGAWLNVGWMLRALWVLPLWLVGGFVAWRQASQAPRRWPLIVLLGLLGLYLFSRAAAAPDFFFLNWAPVVPWKPWRGWIERALALGAIFLLARALGRRALTAVMALALVGCIGAAVVALMHATGGDPLYRIDHPSFFYRLWSYGQSMPRFIYYDPHWNGGTVMPYLVASGVMGPGLFLWPIWKWCATATVYTPAFALLFLVVVPLLAAAACRALTRDRLAWIAAAFLGLGTSHFYYVHLVHYGTFGSIFAAAFLMPLTACLYRIVMLGRTDRWTWIGVVLCGAAALSWPPAALMALPLGVALLFNWRRLRWPVMAGLLACALALVLIFALPALSLMTHSRVGKIAATYASPFTLDFVRAGFVQLGELLRQSHPVILFAGLLGPLALPCRRLRRWFVPLLVSSLLIAAWGKGWKRDLQIDRVWLNALFIGILPAAIVLARLARQRACLARVTAALLCGLLVMGGYTAIKYMGNQGRAGFTTMTPELREIVEWIRGNVPEEGRVMFAGAAVHGYSGGKVAALPVYTGREMMACDYYGFSPKLVEYNYPTREFRKHGPQKLFDFMNLYNITHIITYHDDWKAAFRRLDTQYAEAASFGKKTLFRVLRDSSMIADGAGEVDAGINRIVVTPADPNTPVVVKYNWVDGISCTPAQASIEPWDTGTSVKLIQVNPGGAETVTIGYKRWY
jgi:hypothetical protein